MSRLDDLLAERHQIVAFRNLTKPYQLALVHYMAVDGEAWDALSGVPYGASADEILNAIIQALPQYVGRYGDCQFGVVALPVRDVQQSVMQDEEIRDAFSDWAHYHACLGDMWCLSMQAPLRTINLKNVLRCSE